MTEEEWRERKNDTWYNDLMAERGPKDLEGKDAWNVFPFKEAKEVLKVFSHGAKKYGAPFTYRKGIPNEELFAAIIRHAVEIQIGFDNDKESGLPHAAHIAANALMMLSNKGMKNE